MACDHTNIMAYHGCYLQVNSGFLLLTTGLFTIFGLALTGYLFHYLSPEGSGLPLAWTRLAGCIWLSVLAFLGFVSI